MVYTQDEPDYDVNNQGKESDADNTSVKRVGEITGQPPSKEVIDIAEASKIASVLQGLTFPATKEEIKKYIVSGKAVTISYENARNISKAIEDKLQDGIKYNSIYDVEKALGLVEQK
jgi:hypothetical protein